MVNDSLFNSINVQFMDVHAQSGGSNCGLYGVTYATALCLRQEPGAFQSQMRSHLIRCIENNNFTMFPIANGRRHTSRIRGREIIPIYCTCRMPEFNAPSAMSGVCTMVKCASVYLTKAWKPFAKWICQKCT